MITGELLDFVRLALRRGMSRSTITELLLRDGGWSREDVNEALLAIDKLTTPDNSPALSLRGVKSSTTESATQIFPEVTKGKDVSPSVAVNTPSQLKQHQVILDNEILHDAKQDAVGEKLDIDPSEDFLGIFSPKHIAAHNQVKEKPIAPLIDPIVPKEKEKPAPPSTTPEPQQIHVDVNLSQQSAVNPDVKQSGEVQPPADTNNISAVTTQLPIPGVNVAVTNSNPVTPSPVVTFSVSSTQVNPPPLTQAENKELPPLIVPTMRTITPSSLRGAVRPTIPSLASMHKEVTPTTSVVNQSGDVVTQTVRPTRVSDIAPPRRTMQDLLDVAEGRKQRITLLERRKMQNPDYAPPSQQEDEIDEGGENEERSDDIDLHQEAETFIPPQPDFDHSSGMYDEDHRQELEAQGDEVAENVPHTEYVPPATLSPSTPPTPPPVDQKIIVPAPPVVEAKRPEQRRIDNVVVPEVVRTVAPSKMQTWLEGLRQHQVREDEKKRKQLDVEQAAQKPSTVKPKLANKNSKIKVLSGAKAKTPVTRFVNVIFAALIVLITLSAGAYFLSRYFMMSLPKPLGDSLNNFSSLSSFAYAGNINTDLVFDAHSATSGVGTLQTDLSMDGQLNNTAQGFGDGAHHFKFKSDIQTTSFKWTTDLEGAMKMIGQTLNLHISNPPQNTALDVELLKAYWIRINLDQIAKELALQGVGNRETYGLFGAANNSNDIISVLRRNFPFTIVGTPVVESYQGKDVYHYVLAVDGQKSLDFTREMYHILTNKELLVTSEETVRWSDAMKKMNVAVWIGKEDGRMLRFTMFANLDDEILGTRTTGTIQMDISLSRFNEKVDVDTPTPVLSLDEFRVRMEEFKSKQSVRVEDQKRIAMLEDVMTALAAYHETKGRYPTILEELIPAKLYTPMVSADELADIYYYPYTSPMLQETKPNRCVQKNKQCDAYHAGVNLDDEINPALATDDDVVGEIQGSDSAGCSGEREHYCYDKRVTVGMVRRSPQLSPSPSN